MPSGAQHVGTRKLIEVSLPLETINAESAREKSIRHGHPSTLHLWWARRPSPPPGRCCLRNLSTIRRRGPTCTRARRPDPRPQEAARPDRTARRVGELQRRGAAAGSAREDPRIDRRQPPPILDPFAGGGIPLRRNDSVSKHASDLNPVAVLINKALIEIPPKFAGQRPVFPGAAEESIQTWPRATGLAEDVRRYGQWMRDEAEKRIGHLYPKATLPDGTKATVIAWIWARTVTCPTPPAASPCPRPIVVARKEEGQRGVRRTRHRRQDRPLRDRSRPESRAHQGNRRNRRADGGDVCGVGRRATSTTCAARESTATSARSSWPSLPKEIAAAFIYRRQPSTSKLPMLPILLTHRPVTSPRTLGGFHLRRTDSLPRLPLHPTPAHRPHHLQRPRR